jgi:hypothetical protein
MLRRWEAALLFLVTACWVFSPVTSAANLQLPKGARVGIVNLLDPEVVQFHEARTLQNSFLKTHPVTWRIDVMLANALKDRLEALGLVQVPLAPTDALVRTREDCFLNASLGKGLQRECSPPFMELATAQRLDAIIILGPGLNNSPHGKHRKELPEYLRGWGFVTGQEGKDAKPSLFNMTELLLISTPGSAVNLSARQWGGADELVAWATFTPPPDFKAMPAQQIDELQPMFQDILARQCGLLLGQLAVAE